MGMIERIDANGDDYIAACRNTMRSAFERACAYDEIDPSSLFVAFSRDNPFVVFYDRGGIALQEALAARQNGGFIGLQLSNGRARIPAKAKRGRQ